jgi:hypothetical protein
MIRAEKMLWGRRGLAVTVMTLALLLLFFVPLTLAIMTVLNNVDTISGWIKLASNLKGSEPPSWLVSLPVVGPRIASFLADIVEHGADPLLGKVMPYVGTVAGRVLKEAGQIGQIGHRVQALSDGQQQLFGGLSAVSDVQAQSQTRTLALMEARRYVLRRYGDARGTAALEKIDGTLREHGGAA